MKRVSLLSVSLLILHALTAQMGAQQLDFRQIHGRTLTLPNAPSTVPSGYTPFQVLAAYGLNRVPNQGQGQVIAVIGETDDPNVEMWLSTFDSQYNLPPCTTENGCFKKVYANGQQPQFNPSLAQEIDMDVEWSHAIAPRAQIMLVEATSDSLSDVFQAISVAVAQGANEVSMSVVFPEFNGESVLDHYFQAQGVTFITASGDGGNGPTFYPAASPYVIAVGGSILALSSALPGPNPLSTNYGAEAAWSGSGGGLSFFELEPSWQQSAQQTGFRSMPDVSLDAVNVSYYDQFGWSSGGETSFTCQVWGAIFAIVNSSRAAAGKGPLTQAAADLYSIYANSSAYANDFHDVTTGSNGTCGAMCNAGPGYDFVTGIGTPIGNTLVPALVAMPN